MESRTLLELKKINRNLPGITCPDGDLLELINLRWKDGALRPVTSKVRSTSPQLKIVYKHIVNANTYILIAINTGVTGHIYLAYYVYTGGVLIGSYTAFMEVYTASLIFASLGNALVVSDNTAETTTVLLFNADTNTYTEFSDLVPEMPVPLFRSVDVPAEHFSLSSDPIVVTEIPAPSNFGDLVNILKIGQYNKVVNQVIANGWMAGRYLIRTAWELFDGTIVKHTIPVYLQASPITQEFIRDIFQTHVDFHFDTHFLAANVQFKAFTDAGILAALKLKYKNIVKCLNIYITPTHYSTSLPGDEPPLGDCTDTWQPEITSLAYYLIKQIDLNNLTTDWVTIAPETPAVNITNLETKSSMPVDDFTHHKLHGIRLFGYNERIFMGNIKNTLYPGFNISGVAFPLVAPAPVYVGSNYMVGIEYDILTPQGTKTVFTGWRTLNTYYSLDHSYYEFLLGADSLVTGLYSTSIRTNYWGYPDSRANKARVLIKVANIIYLGSEILLTAVNEMNFSYSISAIFHQNLANMTVTTLKTGQNTYWDGNRVQACELQNPFVWPAINSYRVQGFVLGMATNAIALSQGQFGQYPIFCFTSNGVWAMNIGRGEILIDSITPLSGAVISVPESLCMIDGGVVFTAKDGLMILIGQKDVQISTEIERSFLSPMAGTVGHESIINDPITYIPKTYLCDSEFKTYLIGAMIASYKVDNEQEIIVCNPTKTYSWVYNIINKAWFKISHVWDSFVNDYPKVWGYKLVSGTWYADDMTIENPSEVVWVFMETRPIKFGDAISFKKIHRFNLISYIHPEIERPFGVHMFGSVDNENYFPHLASLLLMPIENHTIGRSSFSCKSYIILAGGRVWNDSYFSGIIADIEKRYITKIH